MAATVRHETRALLRAHLSAASGHPHRTKHCPICHRLLRLASVSDPEPETAAEGAPQDAQDATGDQTPSPA
ncbi:MULTISPECIES: DUF6274 family protein [Streptomyces]|uniref:Uncharacterized protein n=1 Tax=Streptomyces apricus TaxID=1828112 RepID=A0A5B0AXA0_9ACTN|nr:DUF6274 family protein [Streptomyces apricus]KAA0933782.1 hypothetical protein FGF04_19710 [Streptomyces apricus]